MAEIVVVGLLIATVILLLAWRYPEPAMKAYETTDKVVTTFYMLIVLAFALVFITSRMPLLVFVGAVMIALLAIRVLRSAEPTKDHFST